MSAAVARAPQRGFTLLEVLLAMAITAMVAVMAYAGLSAAMSAAERHGAQVKRLGEVQSALGYLVRDLRQSVDRPVMDARDELEPAIMGDAVDDEFLQLTHTGWDNPRGQRRGALQRVRYRLDANGDLWREHWLVLDRVDDEDHLQSVKLLEGVDKVALEFLDGKSANSKSGSLPAKGSGKSKASSAKDMALGGEWVERWPQTEGDTLMPLAVQIELEIKGIGTVRRVVGLANAQSE